MSRRRIGPRPYCCLDDCRQEGCPGHVLVLENCRIAGTYTVIRDGKCVHFFDGNELPEIVAAYLESISAKPLPYFPVDAITPKRKPQ